MDSKGDILYASPSIAKIFGYDPNEISSRNCLDLFHPEDRTRSKEQLREVLTRPSSTARWDARVRHKNGDYSWAENTFSNLLKEAEVRAIVMHQRDITARKAMEAEREQHAKELMLSNLRLEEFAYTAAHDLREPLRAISLYTECIDQRGHMDAEEKRMATFIVDGAARMAALIDDMLSFASTGIQEAARCVDLQEVLGRAMTNLSQMIKTSGAVVTNDPLPPVMGNEIHLVRLFQNLLSNAVKYRSEGSVRIHVSVEQRGAVWVIGIKDSGVGIAQQYHTEIFTPFRRLVSRDVPGTGLGLAVCRKIVEGFGGVIWVESEPGAGSTFFFTIAVMAQPEMAASPPSRNPEA